MAMEKVNQQTLADRLGLSRATVSRCFTNHRAINPSTRARVFDLAAELGYRYMELRTQASGRASRGTTLGVLICHPASGAADDRFESPRQILLDGISQAAQLQRVQLSVHYVDPDEKTLEDPSYNSINALRRGSWSGVLLIQAFPDDVIGALAGRLPCVSLLEQYEHAHVNCVDVDHERGISGLVDLLIESGHQRIGFFSVHHALGTYWATHRLSAYFEKLLAAGFAYRPADAINISKVPPLTEADALRAMLAQTRNGVTAWVCANDYAAYAVINQLTAAGVRVPEEVSVTGFDGIQPPNGIPHAATLETPFREIGRTAAGRLLRLAERPFDPPQHILVAGQVRRGETVGPVAERESRDGNGSVAHTERAESRL
jgi:LacI family transcriptional regulator